MKMERKEICVKWHCPHCGHIMYCALKKGVKLMEPPECLECIRKENKK